MFVTSFGVNDSDAALGIVACGWRHWNVENGFKVEKNDGFGLEHAFCNDEMAGRNYHILSRSPMCCGRCLRTACCAESGMDAAR